MKYIEPYILNKINIVVIFFSKLCSFSSITGIISKKSFPVFERVLWRRLRGNLLIKSKNVNRLIDNKTVF